MKIYAENVEAVVSKGTRYSVFTHFSVYPTDGAQIVHPRPYRGKPMLSKFVDQMNFEGNNDIV